MEKVAVFTKEYEYIKDEQMQEDLKYLVNCLPDYFFEVPASSSKKYHSGFANTKGGLVKHVKVAVAIANCLLENETTGKKFSKRDKDLIIMALVLHDGFKLGRDQQQYTLVTHPLVISEVIMENKDKLKMSVDDIRKLCCMIESHMGQWNYDYLTHEEVLPKPKNELERFVHMCDYLASRKFLNVSFNGLDIKA